MKISKFLLRYRHHGAVVLMVAMMGGFANALVLNGTPKQVISYVLVLIAMYGILSSGRHREMPCEICIEKMPLNASEQAESKSTLRWLRLQHFAYGTVLRANVGLMVWIVALTAVGMLMPGKLGDSISALITGFYCLTMWASRVHNQYQPWCPFCRKPGGGDGETEVAPAPKAPQFA